MAAVLGGCAGRNEASDYVEGEVNGSAINASNSSSRTERELMTAAALAETEANRLASPVESLEIEGHEFAIEEGFKGPTVRGTVANTGTKPIEFAEVRVRVYDSTGAHLARYVDSTGDLSAETRWRFEVILLTPAEKIDDYDIGVFGILQ